MLTPREWDLRFWEALHRLNQSPELIALRLGLSLEALEQQLSQAETRINSRVIADAPGKLIKTGTMMTPLLERVGWERCGWRRLRA